MQMRDGEVAGSDLVASIFLMKSESADLNLPNRTAIARELCVGGEECNPFAQRLREQHPVKGIFVDCRQIIDIDSVLAGDRQLDVTILDEASTEHTRLNLEIVASERALDRDLPDAGCAEHKLVAVVAQLFPSRSRQPLWLPSRP